MFPFSENQYQSQSAEISWKNIMHKNMSNLLVIMGYSGVGENYVRNYKKDLGKLSCQLF